MEAGAARGVNAGNPQPPSCQGLIIGTGLARVAATLIPMTKQCISFHRFVCAALLLWSVPRCSRAAEPANVITAQEQAAGWTLLCNGRSLAGWRLYGQPAPPGKGWVAAEGVLHKLATEKGGDIITERIFNDFDLAWEWRISPGGNNGIKYLVTEARPSAPGHEYQMLDDDGHPDGKLGAKRQTAAFYDVLPPAANKPLKPVGEWNSSRVLVQGNHVEHWLNGVKVLEYELGSQAIRSAVAASKFKNVAGFGTKIRGRIMLTDHQDECWFRNLRIRELDPR